MNAADVITAAVGLVGALIGAGAGYLGAVRSAARSNRPAWTSAALDAARSLLGSHDPAERAQGSRLLQAAAAAIGADPDAPEQIRRATRSVDLARAVQDARAGADHPAAAPEPRRSAAERGAPPTARTVDAARAEVEAFRAAGLAPDAAAVRLAESSP